MREVERRVLDLLDRAGADAILSEFDDSPVRLFVLTLAERRIRDCLRQPSCAVLA